MSQAHFSLRKAADWVKAELEDEQEWTVQRIVHYVDKIKSAHPLVYLHPLIPPIYLPLTDGRSPSSQSGNQEPGSPRPGRTSW